MDDDLRKAEVQHRFLQIKQSRSFNFLWLCFTYSIIIWFFVIMSLITLGIPKKPIFIVSAIVWILSYVKLIVKEKTFLDDLRKKMFKKKDEEQSDLVEFDER